MVNKKKRNKKGHQLDASYRRSRTDKPISNPATTWQVLGNLLLLLAYRVVRVHIFPKTPETILLSDIFSLYLSPFLVRFFFLDERVGMG